MNNPIDFFKSLFKNKKTTLTGREAIALQYLHPEKGAINTGDYCTTQDIANLVPVSSSKVYKAIVTQTGTNVPIANVINSNDKNFLSGVQIKRYDVGYYGFEIQGATDQNTICLITYGLNNRALDGFIHVGVGGGGVALSNYVAGVPSDTITQLSIYIEYYGS